MPNTRISAGVAGGLLAVSLVLTGCGSPTTAPANPAPSTPSAAQSATQHNDADEQFAQMMIPHHRDAVAMAELAADRAENAEVKTLAEQIQAAQQPEIDQLTGFLNAWGAEVPPSNSMEGMDHGSMPSASSASGMSGMMTPAQMEQLRNATGAQFDEMFLTMMIEHHRGAIGMARDVADEGENDEVTALAKRIAADQESQIAQMSSWLDGQ